MTKIFKMITLCEGILLLLGFISLGSVSVSIYLLAVSIKSDNLAGTLVYTGGALAFGVIIGLICYIMLHLNPKIDKLEHRQMFESHSQTSETCSVPT